jgi:molybdenum cofactor biosynthesis enzyme MoaA
MVQEVAKEERGIRVRLSSHGSDDVILDFRHLDDVERSWFNTGDVSVSYRPGLTDPAQFAAAAKEISAALDAACRNASSSSANTHNTAADRSWSGVHDALLNDLRQRLAGRPNESIRLGDVVDDGLPDRPCVLPWVRLEYAPAAQYGPCCVDYQTLPARDGMAGELDARWNSSAMRNFRAALSTHGHPSTCRESCPWLSGGRMALPELRLYGGTDPFVDNQLLALADILEGRTTSRSVPQQICFPTTTYCNYDCLMCEYGEIGTLNDELPQTFYTALEPWLDRVQMLDVLGGEPLASPVFRQFLAHFNGGIHPQLRLAMTTNGSYLTPSFIEQIRHVPFGSITVSLNAATPATYSEVNRGLDFARIRQNLDALLKWKRQTGVPNNITYSMVLLQSNLTEIEEFAALAERDTVRVRFMLPMHNRNQQSIFTSFAAMDTAVSALERVAARMTPAAAADVAGEIAVIRRRIEARILSPMPDGF